MNDTNMKALDPIPLREKVVLCFSPATGQILIEDDGTVIDSAQARSLWSCGMVDNCNIAFQRLATQFEFNVDTCLKWYENNR